MKKFLSVVLSITMLATLIPMTYIVTANAQAVPPSNKLTVADFGGGSIPSGITVKDRNGDTSHSAAMDTSVGYNGRSSLAYTFGNNSGTHIIIPFTSAWNQYSTFTLRVYSNVANQKINIIINETAEVSSSKDNGYWQKTPFTTNGAWQTLSVNISDLKAKWATTSPQSVYIFLTSKDWGISPGTLAEFNAGTKNSITNEKFHIDSVWLEKANFGGTLAAPIPSIENGAANIPANLDGNNTFTMTFDKTIWNTDYSESVKVYNITGSNESVISSGYSVSTSGNNLKVVFDSQLSRGDYKIVLDSENFWGSNGEILDSDAEFIFSVEKGSAYFIPASVSIEDGATNVDATAQNFTYSVTFNNEIDDTDIDQKISFTKNDGTYEDYEIICEDNVLTLKFNNPLESRSTYKLTLSSELCDIDGAKLGSEKSYSFKTAREITTIGSDGIVFDARNTIDLEDGLLNPGGMVAEITNTNTLIGNKTLKISYKAEQDKTATISPRLGDISDFSYINWLIYSPKADGEAMRLMIATVKAEPASGDSFFLYTGKTDWQGWKVISVPISSLQNYRSADKTQVIGHTVNFGGWGDKRTQDGYILVDRIWYTNEAVTELSLESAEYAYEEAYIPANLGGDNAYTFTFNQNLEDKDYSDAVSIEIYDDSDFVSSNTAFETEVDGANLNIKFPSGLTSGNTYRIIIDSTAIMSENATFGKLVYPMVFTVDAASPYFRLVSSSPQNASTVEEINEITLEFNNEPAQCYFPDYIFLYCNGVKQYNAFSCKKDGKKLVLTLSGKTEPGCEYTLKIDNKYADVFANSIIGDAEFTFNTKPASEKVSVISLFSAGNDEHFTNGLNSGTFTQDIGIKNLYSRAARFSYTAGRDMSTYPFNGQTIDMTGIKYLNTWVYSPEASNDIFNIIVYKVAGTKEYTRYPVPLDWTGWKLLSIPTSSIGNYASIQSINFNFGGWTTTVNKNNYIVYDEIWLSAQPPQAIELAGTNHPDGYSNALVANEILEFTYNQKVNTSITPVISVFDEAGNEINDFSYKIEAEKLIISFGTLTPDTEYTVSVGGISGTHPVFSANTDSVSFTTALDGVYLTNISFTPEAIAIGGNVKATYQILNTSSNPASLKLNLFATDEDNRLLAYAEDEISAPANDTENFDLGFTCPNGTANIYAYVLDNNSRMLSKVYSVMTADSCITHNASILPGDKAAVTIGSAELNVNVLKVSMTAKGVSEAIIVEVSGEQAVSKGIVKADSKGNAVFYYVFPDDAQSRTYTITAKSDTCSDTFEIGYVSKSERDSLLGLANANSQSDLKELISDLSEKIDIGNPSDKEIEDIAKLVLDNKPYNSYAEVLDKIITITTLLDNINTSNWNTLGAVIKQNTDLLGENDDDIKYFMSLSEKKQNKICEIMVGDLPADSIGGFNRTLSDAIVEYKNSLNSGSGSGGSVGGSNGGLSSSVSYSAGSSAPAPYTPIEANSVFNDMDSAHWAQDSVMTLYKEGVISYPADNKFRPNDNITREEFVKMVVCAFVSDTPRTTHRFKDEAEGAWYNEHLAKAYAAGITTGYPDGSFGIGELITREDMVTICARTLESLGHNMTSDMPSGFSDTAYISDYASGYVSAMTQTGVINGMGDGSFAPKANATRAQAAKIIAGLMKIY